jgi:hypothetical protein
VIRFDRIRITVWILYLEHDLSENRYPLFGIML